MFHRIVVVVIRVPREILFIAQGVLPKAPLPNAAFDFARALAETRSPAGSPCENTDLISRQRNAKSTSPSANVQIA
jgi:hypothetical protein